ncbi:hypothetical protein EVAR_50260_1 [Eumeta japonica]|uniref:Uncharacterized protein n=1 Tax=Eumeta variegata TaxID=151549 RepID=A0A4C1Y925_EUMVA|nr:hypothetical protein EVAR_50260_1 [Eumeta japonica]
MYFNGHKSEILYFQRYTRKLKVNRDRHIAPVNLVCAVRPISRPARGHSRAVSVAAGYGKSFRSAPFRTRPILPLIALYVGFWGPYVVIGNE